MILSLKSEDAPLLEQAKEEFPENINVINTRSFGGNSFEIQAIITLSAAMLSCINNIVVSLIKNKKSVHIMFKDKKRSVEIDNLSEKNSMEILKMILQKESIDNER